MNPAERFIRLATAFPKAIMGSIFTITLLLMLIAALPTISPDNFPMLNGLKIDTDPENMLSADEEVRVFHNKMKKEFSLHDMIVVGVENNKHPQGVFNKNTLSNIYRLSEYARTLRWPEARNPEIIGGVIAVDMIAPDTVDSIRPEGEAQVVFEWLLPEPPENEQEALAVREKALRIPFLNDTLVSGDGKAIALYLPISRKDLSHKISALLQEKIKEFDAEEKYFITGLPVANDTFGVEMFKQMAISAPLAGIMIFLLMLYFFRKLLLVTAPMIMAGLTVACTMGMLVISGHTVHIMSSMIPIFIMPIAVLDSVHILSEFFDRYQKNRNRTKTLHEVLKELFIPMLYTSLTSTAGFASLALTPIPPVQVFGIFVGIGVMLAWFYTVTFIPAFIMLIPEKSLENFGRKAVKNQNHNNENTLLERFFSRMAAFTYRRYQLVIAFSVILFAIAINGIYRIQVNDNPVLWFEYNHPIRVADRALNNHFGGTYMAYLSLEAETEKTGGYTEKLAAELKVLSADYKELPETENIIKKILQMTADKEKQQTNLSSRDFFTGLEKEFSPLQQKASDEYFYFMDDISALINRLSDSDQIFKQPELLNYITEIQEQLLKTGVVGKSNSISDIVKTVHRDLMGGHQKEFRIPDSAEAVAQCLLTYQNSHRPQDLWHMITPDYRKANLWLQLKSGNNRDMQKVVNATAEFIKNNKPPLNIQHNWFGLTYINVIWQEKMVVGMLQSFLGSFLVVFLMMTILFRSPLWGILSMIPLSLTIAFIYGTIGYIGKDYDMPIAVLSSLTLGLAVDFAIHFLARSRSVMEKHDSWAEGMKEMFGEPTRAIWRNIVVVAVGFTPLLFAPLIPYKTVGVFMATILGVAGFATLLLLPAIIRLLEKILFAPEEAKGKSSCCCCECFID
jgi:predicted RND superfamily exporter protein